MLRVVSTYCTVSGDAALVIAGIPPIDLLGSERHALSRSSPSGLSKQDALGMASTLGLLYHRQMDIQANP